MSERGTIVGNPYVHMFHEVKLDGHWWDVVSGVSYFGMGIIRLRRKYKCECGKEHTTEHILETRDGCSHRECEVRNREVKDGE